MAKVTGPMFSVSASGQFAKSMVFDKRGYVREYVVPANPQTVLQMATRDALADLQTVLKTAGTTIRVAMRSRFGARWNSMIIGELMANDGAAFDAYVAVYTAFSAPNKLNWVAADLQTYKVGNKGEMLFAVCSAIYDLNLRLGGSVSMSETIETNSESCRGDLQD